MSWRSIPRLVETVLGNPGVGGRDILNVPARVRGVEFGRRWERLRQASSRRPTQTSDAKDPAANPLSSYFDGVTEGPGIWKWQHYFEIYHRHLSKFVGRPVTVVEVGIYSGGSLPMWRHYFGPGCRVHGVDIEPDCRTYANEYTTIHIGDQADRGFWKRFRETVPEVDVLIDDGGHLPEQQMITLEETLPYLNAGGVYICEDVHGARNPFGEFVRSLADGLNAFDVDRASKELASRVTPLQAAVHSVHLYPFVTAIEIQDTPVGRFKAPMHGTQWQPFLGAIPESKPVPSEPGAAADPAPV